MKQPLNTLPGEEWRPITEAPQYHISNLGRIASFVLTKPYIKRHTQDKRGYCRVSLRPSKAQAVTRYVHILVASAFLPPQQPGQEVDHINGIPSDNTAQNLRWCSHKDNIQHSFSRRGNWLAQSARGRYGSPVYQISPDSITKHISLSLACKAINRTHSASANISRAIKSGRMAYGFNWSKHIPKLSVGIVSHTPTPKTSNLTELVKMA